MPEQSKPNILYHYTRIEAFRSIVESRKIRATRYDQMNDESEIQIGLQQLLEAVKGHQTNRKMSEYKEFLIEGINGFIEALDQGLDAHQRLNVYVLSFSEDADCLDHWRAYVPHGGVAIGFDFQKVREGFLCDITGRVGGQPVKNPIRSDPANPLLRCEYTDRQGLIDLRKRLTEQFFKEDSYPALFARRDQNSSMAAMLHSFLSQDIYRTICAVKHGAYAQEKEWRCVNFLPDPTDDPVKLSETNKCYIEMEFDPREYIKEVWISPHGDKQAYECVIDSFTERGDLDVIVKKSDIPFRG